MDIYKETNLPLLVLVYKVIIANGGLLKRSTSTRGRAGLPSDYLENLLSWTRLLYPKV